MNQLDKIKRDAQSAANRSGDPVAVFNLNPYSPLYVMRSLPAHAGVPKNAVFVAYPSTTATPS